MKVNKKVKSPIKNGVAKVPVVMQLEALECGAACLTMIMAYYGLWLPLERVRYECGVSRDGSNAKNLLLVARQYGFDAAGYRMEPESLREEGIFPCIVHWEFNHFIVVDGFKGNKVYVNDPGKGNYSMSIERFDEGFTGICLMFEPTESFKIQGKPKSVWEFAIRSLRSARAELAFVAVTTAIAAGIEIINAGFSRVFLDRILSGRNPAWLYPFMICLAIFAAIQISMEWTRSVYSLKINGKMAISGSATFMWKVLHLPMTFFSQRMAGDIQSRMEDNAGIASTVSNTLAPLALNAFMMIFYLVVMLRYSVILTCVGIGSIVINMLVRSFISSKRVNLTRVLMRDTGKLYGMTVSGIEMIETIKSSGSENGFFEKWSGYQAGVNAGNVKVMKLEEELGIIPQIVSMCTDALVTILGILFVMRGNFLPGMVIAFKGFLDCFVAPADSLALAGATIQEMRSQMERIEDVMKYPSDVIDTVSAADEINKDTDYAKLKGALELKNVTFGYSRLAEPLIEDFSLKLEPGHSVAFVGSSGCGKSTLSKLISGLYKPWSGEILFDGRPIESIDRSVFTSSLAVVDQDIILFEDSISSNIKMWDSTIEDFEMIMAARDAQIHEDIMKRDGGYSYKLNEGGKDFSGGQRQRIEIARVLAQDPTIIIMDEATSALDARTEFDVVSSIKDRGISCIVVAHRLSTIRDCDEIIVLDHGKVVERGTHEELYKRGGLYTELVSNE